MNLAILGTVCLWNHIIFVLLCLCRPLLKGKNYILQVYSITYSDVACAHTHTHTCVNVGVNLVLYLQLTQLENQIIKLTLKIHKTLYD